MLFFIAAGGARGADIMPKWEYYYVRFDYHTGPFWLNNSGSSSQPANSLYELLNQLGREGWELVVSHAESSTTGLIFKRQVE
jgi:hypothetical protein